MRENVVIAKGKAPQSPTAGWNPGEWTGLGRRIRERLAAAEEARRLRQERRRRAITEMDERLKRYTAVADRLMAEVVRPAMRQLADCFAGLARPDEEQSRHTSVCRFPHTARFPFTAALELGVTRDGDARTVVVQYDLQILPTLSPVRAHDRHDLPLDEIDQPRVARWVDEHILAFVDSYLRLETAEP